MSVPITNGQGQSSIAAELVGGLQYQRIEVLGAGGASVLAVNPDGSFNASVIGIPTVSFGSSDASVITVFKSSSVIAVVTGSVAQGTTPWAVTNVGSVITTNIGSVITTNVGSVITVLQSSSIIAINAGSVITVPSNNSVITVLQSPSIVGTYAEDSAHTTADKGLFVLGVRNDAVASFAGANGEYGPIGTDSAGRVVTKPFSPEESRIEGYITLTSTSVTTLVAAAGAGLRNYITDVIVANTGAATTLVTMTSQGGASVLGYTIAPTGGGSNIVGMATPIRTGVNETFGVQAATATSTLYVTVKGFRAP